VATLFVHDDARPIRRELREGERLTGVVLALPTPGAFDGNRLVLKLSNGCVSVPATARRGWTVLERELAKARVGDTIIVHFVGWRERGDGGRYRLVRVKINAPGGL
jgi:hypothetical protein